MSAPSPLLPRYRRPLTFGAILDETFRIYRRSWLVMVAVSALWAFPYTLVSFLGGVLSSYLLGSDPGFNPRDPSLAFAFAGRAFVYGLAVQAILMPFALVGDGALTAVTQSVLCGERGSVWRAYAVGFRRFIALVGASLVWYVALALLTLLAIPLFVLGAFGLLGGLIALVGVIVWAANPGSRRPWLKWLIVLATPFGLPIYFAIRWSLYGQAVVLEGAGPIAAARRSGELVRGHWFHVLGVLIVVSLIVIILETIPVFIGGMVASIVAPATTGLPQADLASSVAQGASSLIGLALFGSISFIASTLLFVDLRNRHEGADLTERLEQLEASVPPAA